MYEWTQDDAQAFVAFCVSLGITDYTVPLRVFSNESNNEPNPPRDGPAVGLCQFEPATLKGLGYPLATDPNLDAFCAMTVAQQLGWCVKYYGSYRAHCGTVAGFYLATFLPAQCHLETQPDAIVCGPGVYEWAYAPNAGFDRAKRGYIVVQDLVDAADRQYGPRAQAIAALVARHVDTNPEVDNPPSSDRIVEPSDIGPTAPVTLPGK